MYFEQLNDLNEGGELFEGCKNEFGVERHINVFQDEIVVIVGGNHVYSFNYTL